MATKFEAVLLADPDAFSMPLSRLSLHDTRAAAIAAAIKAAKSQRAAGAAFTDVGVRRVDDELGEVYENFPVPTAQI